VEWSHERRMTRIAWVQQQTVIRSSALYSGGWTTEKSATAGEMDRQHHKEDFKDMKLDVRETVHLSRERK